MQISRSTEESVRLIATALASLADTVAEIAGSVREIEQRIEHIESFLESLEIEEEEPRATFIIDGEGSILPCSFEAEDLDLDRWYGEGGPCPHDED